MLLKLCFFARSHERCKISSLTILLCDTGKSVSPLSQTNISFCLFPSQTSENHSLISIHSQWPCSCRWYEKQSYRNSVRISHLGPQSLLKLCLCFRGLFLRTNRSRISFGKIPSSHLYSDPFLGYSSPFQFLFHPSTGFYLNYFPNVMTFSRIIRADPKHRAPVLLFHVTNSPISLSPTMFPSTNSTWTHSLLWFQIDHWGLPWWLAITKYTFLTCILPLNSKCICPFWHLHLGVSQTCQVEHAQNRCLGFLLRIGPSYFPYHLSEWYSWLLNFSNQKSWSQTLFSSSSKCNLSTNKSSFHLFSVFIHYLSL